MESWVSSLIFGVCCSVDLTYVICVLSRVQGVRVQGYCFWTISDNWEWADGYGPKFGLVAVDRHKNLDRHPRPSYYLYAEVLL